MFNHRPTQRLGTGAAVLWTEHCSWAGLNTRHPRPRLCEHTEADGTDLSASSAAGGSDAASAHAMVVLNPDDSRRRHAHIKHFISEKGCSWRGTGNPGSRTGTSGHWDFRIRHSTVELDRHSRPLTLCLRHSATRSGLRLEHSAQQTFQLPGQKAPLCR